MAAAASMQSLDAWAELHFLKQPEAMPRELALMRVAFFWAMRHPRGQLTGHRYEATAGQIAEHAMHVAAEVVGAVWPRGRTAYHGALKLAIEAAREKHKRRRGRRWATNDNYAKASGQASEEVLRWLRDQRIVELTVPIALRAFASCDYDNASSPTIVMRVGAKADAATLRGTWGAPKPPHYVISLPIKWLARVYNRGLAVARHPEHGLRFILDASPIQPLTSDRWSVVYAHSTRPDRYGLDKLQPKEAIAVRQPDGSFLLEKLPRKPRTKKVGADAAK